MRSFKQHFYKLVSFILALSFIVTQTDIPINIVHAEENFVSSIFKDAQIDNEATDLEAPTESKVKLGKSDVSESLLWYVVNATDSELTLYSATPLGQLNSTEDIENFKFETNFTNQELSVIKEVRGTKFWLPYATLYGQVIYADEEKTITIPCKYWLHTDSVSRACCQDSLMTKFVGKEDQNSNQVIQQGNRSLLVGAICVIDLTKISKAEIGDDNDISIIYDDSNGGTDDKTDDVTDENISITSKMFIGDESEGNTYKSGNITNQDVTIVAEVIGKLAEKYSISCGIKDKTEETVEIGTQNKILENNHAVIEYCDPQKVVIKVTSDGNHSIKITAIGGNNIDASTEQILVKIDKTPPLSPAELSGFNDNTCYTNCKTPKISGKGEKGCTLTAKEDEKILSSILIEDDDGSWNLTLPELSDGVHTISLYQCDSAGNVSEPAKTSDGNLPQIFIDATGPQGKITVKKNELTEFLRKISSNLFFKNTVSVEITATDEYNGNTNVSGIKDIKYIISDKIYNETEIKDENIEWLPYEKTLKISYEESQKRTVYAKITDNAGNVSYISSDNLVQCVDSEQTTEEIFHTKLDTQDINVPINFNNNTIDKITNIGTTENNVEDELKINENYTSNDKSVTFKANFLNSLEETKNGDYYSIKISLNPAGVAVTNYDGPNILKDLTIKLHVQKKSQTTPLDIEFSTDNQNWKSITKNSNSFRYGDKPYYLRAVGGDGNGNYTVISDNKAVSCVNNLLTFNAPCENFRLTVEKNCDSNYSKSSFQTPNMSVLERELICGKNDIQLSNNNAKIFDGTTIIPIIGGNVEVINKIPTDQVSIDVMSGKANFSSRNVSDKNKITFNDFKLSGKDAWKYSLKSQPSSIYGKILPRKVAVKLDNINISKPYDSNNKVVSLSNSELFELTDVENDSDTGLLSQDNSKVFARIVDNHATYADKNVGENIKINGTIELYDKTSSKHEKNYQLVENNLEKLGVVGKVTPRNLNINVTIKDKFYDGTNHAEFDNYRIIDSDKTTKKLINAEKLKLNEKDSSGNVCVYPEYKNFEVGTKKTATIKGKFKLMSDSNELFNAKNYKLITPKIAKGNIFSQKAGGSEYVIKADGNNGWFIGKTIVTANSGYELSVSNAASSDWKKSLTVDDFGDLKNSNNSQSSGCDIKFYIKNLETGVISDAVTKNIKRDSSAPKAEIDIKDKNWWQNLANTISFDNVFDETKNVSFNVDDSLSGVEKIYWHKHNGDKLNEVDILNMQDRDWNLLDGTELTVDDKNDSTLYTKIVDSAGNVRYLGTDGTNFTSPKTDLSNSEEGEIVSLKSDETNVLILTNKGALPEDTRLSSKKIENFDSTLLKKGNFQHVQAYDITLKNSSNENVQPKNYVTCCVPIPDSFDKDKAQIYRIEGTENIEYVTRTETIDSKDYAVFETDHFSIYVLTDAATEEQTEVPKHSDPETEEHYKRIKNTVIYACTGLFISILIISLFHRKKHLKESNL